MACIVNQEELTWLTFASDMQNTESLPAGSADPGTSLALVSVSAHPSHAASSSCTTGWICLTLQARALACLVAALAALL